MQCCCRVRTYGAHGHAQTAALPVLVRRSAIWSARRRHKCQLQDLSTGWQRSLVTTAAEAAGSVAPSDSSSNNGRLAAYFVLWYSFNVVFNILNKATLNIFPMPWFIGTWQLAASGLFMSFLWLFKIHPIPKLPRGFFKSLLPVAFFHTIGHVAACVSFSKLAVSFTHVIKASEPVFTVALSGANPAGP